MRIFYKKKADQIGGFILINVLVFAVIAIITTTALVTWGGTVLKSTRQLTNREQAFQIAEAGVDYYRWHLAHWSSDYYDGNASTSTGPYVHQFYDKDANLIGSYALTITPPPSGSSIVKIKSTGTVIADPTISRSIQTTLAIPSLARYAVAANDVMRFGAGTEVFGPIHSNNGIRFDGLAHNVITSALSSYVDPDNGSATRYGVYTTVGTTDPSPPTAVPSRPDVFMAGRQFPVPTIDFTGMTTDLSSMKTAAQSSSGRYLSSSGAMGYHIILKTNDTFDLYKVTSLTSASNSCSSGQSGNWGTWSIQNQTFVANYAFPANGVIFADDHLWVDGQINGARLTIAAGRFPDSSSTWRSITVNSNLLYTNKDGSDVIALVAQGDINAGLSSLDTLEIDAALVAQNGRVGRYYYNSNCGSSYVRSTLTLYGMLATNLRYGFAYTDGTGYQTRNIIYDGNLLYGPPPNFPLTSSQYSTISWNEVK